MFSKGFFFPSTLLNITMVQSKNKNQSSTKNGEKKIVRFSTLLTLREHLHILDFAPNEKQDCWYTREEFREQRKEIRNIAQMLKYGIFVDEEEYSLRGLEDRCARQTRYAARLAVISEQDIQQDLCIRNESMIRNVYSQHSHSSAVAAHRRALQDEKDARSILLDSSSIVNHEVTRMESILCKSTQQMPTQILVSLAA